MLADLVSYPMTGTVQMIDANSANAPVHVGDRIAWTLQYDRSLPSLPNPPKAPPEVPNTYMPATTPLSGFVDLTTSTPLPSPPNTPLQNTIPSPSMPDPPPALNPPPQPSTTPSPLPPNLIPHPGSGPPPPPNTPPPPANGNTLTLTGLTLTRGSNIVWGAFIANVSWRHWADGSTGNASLNLTSYSHNFQLPTSDLARLQLNSVPFNVRSLSYDYWQYPSSMTEPAPGLDFYVQADPLSVSAASAPEPSSFVLLALGAAGLIGGRVRAALGVSPVRAADLVHGQSRSCPCLKRSEPEA